MRMTFFSRSRRRLGSVCGGIYSNWLVGVGVEAKLVRSISVVAPAIVATTDGLNFGVGSTVGGGEGSDTGVGVATGT